MKSIGSRCRGVLEKNQGIKQEATANARLLLDPQQKEVLVKYIVKLTQEGKNSSHL